MKTIKVKPEKYISHGCRNAESGASLLEVLIAIVIMSFGLLALGGLTAASVQYGKMAQFQTVGVQLAADYADRMRANASGFRSDLYNKTTVYSTATAAIAIPACAVVSNCTTPEMAAIDLAEWRNSLRRSLPGGDAYVVRDAVNLPAVDIWVMWTDPGLANGMAANGACPAAAIAGVTEVPRCLYFRVSI